MSAIRVSGLKGMRTWTIWLRVLAIVLAVLMMVMVVMVMVMMYVNDRWTDGVAERHNDMNWDRTRRVSQGLA